MTLEYRIGDVFDRLAEIPDGTIDLIVTSPPFLALRSYLPADHPDKHREIGSEATPADFLDTLLALTAEWGRVLAPHGSLCVELGDMYSGSGGAGGDYNPGGLREGQDKFEGSAYTARQDTKYPKVADAKATGGGITNLHGKKSGGGSGWPLAKSMTLIPNLYPACLAYGRNLLTGQPSPAGQWRIRNLIVWARPNPPVGALGDKFRPATSYITVACRGVKRYFDLDAVRTGRAVPGDNTKGSDDLSERFTHRIDSNPAGAPPLDWHADHHPEDGDWLWKLSTQPFSGWVETVRHVRVPADEHAYGSQRTVSPNCPVHGSQDHQGSNARDGERAAGSSNHTARNGARHAQVLVDDSPPTFWTPGLMAEDAAPVAPAATRRSKSSNRTAHAPATNPADTPCVQTLDRTDGTPTGRESSAPHPDTPESSISSDDSDASREPQTADGIARKHTDGSCTCTYHVVESITERNSHYATFPMALPKRLIEAMCPLRVCTVCGRPSERIVGDVEYLAQRGGTTDGDAAWRSGRRGTDPANGQNTNESMTRNASTLGWSDCGHDAWRTGIVLDPFAGSGTTLEAAQAVGRHAIGIDLDARNADLARDRVGMFLTIDERATA